MHYTIYFILRKGREEEGVASWSKHDSLLILTTIIDDIVSGSLSDELTGTIVPM